MKKTKFQIDAEQPFRAVMVFLHKLLKLPLQVHSSSSMSLSSENSNGNSPHGSLNANGNGNATTGGGSQNTNKSYGSLFLYCNAAFVPSPCERLGDLRDCFNVRGDLVIYYSLQEAWG